MWQELYMLWFIQFLKYSSGLKGFISILQIRPFRLRAVVKIKGQNQEGWDCDCALITKSTASLVAPLPLTASHQDPQIYRQVIPNMSLRKEFRTATPKYCHFGLRMEGTWETANTGRGAFSGLLTCLDTQPPKRTPLSWVLSPGISSTRTDKLLAQERRRRSTPHPRALSQTIFYASGAVHLSQVTSSPLNCLYSLSPSCYKKGI